MAQNGILSVTENQTANSTLVATDIDGETLTYSIVSQPAHGTVKITDAATGAYTYTPAQSYTGADGFTFKANDGNADSNAATVSITVNPTTATIPTIIQKQPLLRIVSLAIIPPGTGLLYYGEIAYGTPDCPGRSAGQVGCQTYSNYIVGADYCGFPNDLAIHAAATGNEADFLHYAAPISASNRDTGSTFSIQDARCGNYPGLLAGVYYFMNFASPDSQTWLANKLLNSTALHSNGIFMDGIGLWYNTMPDYVVEFGSTRSSCPPYPTCDHPYVSGGLDNISYDTALGDLINKVQPGFHVILNNMNLAQVAGVCAALTTTAPYHCVGSHYNSNMYDSRMQLDQVCGAITSNTDLDLIRAENSQDSGAADAPRVNPVLGEDDAGILNSIYDLQYNQTNNGCKHTGILLEESLAWMPGARWDEDDMTAMQWMAPSADGTPDMIAQNPYSYCITGGAPCSTDFAVWPDTLIVPYGPKFTTSPYNIGTYTSPHDATDCPAAGQPVSVQGDSGGGASRVVYCQAAAYPVFAAAYNHCYFVGYDLGECIAIFNTGTVAVPLSAITKLTLSDYHYALSYGGVEWGGHSNMGGSTSVAGMFPWLSSSSGLYKALVSEHTACSSATYCNGVVAFVPFSSSTTIPAHSPIFLVANKPSNY